MKYLLVLFFIFFSFFLLNTADANAGIVFETDFSNDTGWTPVKQAGYWQQNNPPSGWTAYKNPSGTIQAVEAGAGVGGGNAYKIGYAIGNVSPAVSLLKHLTGNKSTGYNELYIRYHVRFGDNWKSGSDGTNTEYWKWGRLWQYRSPTNQSEWSENEPPEDTRYILLNLNGSPSYWGAVVSDNVNGNSSSGQRIKMNWALDPISEGHFETVSDWSINKSGSNAGLFNKYPATQGWHTIEFHIKLSTISAPGNGLFEMWIDGVKQPKYGRIQNKGGASGYTEFPTKAYNGGINVFVLFDNMASWSEYWNVTPPSGDTGQKFIYVNDVVVSTDYVGPDYVVGGGTPLPTCTSFTYTPYGACKPNNTQTRAIISSLPAGCTGGNPVTEQSCTYTPPPPPSTLIISSVNPSNYQTANLTVGDQYYIDRTYTISSIPSSYEGLLWIKTGNDDKSNTSASFITFNIDKNATVYVAYDSRASSLPNWLTSSYTNTSSSITVSDDASTLNIWQRNFTTGTVTLGGNLASGASGAGSMYTVFVKPSTSAPPTLQGDLNGDNTVNTLDWSMMNSRWNTADTTADINGDGVVNTLDWSIMNGEWGENI